MNNKKFFVVPPNFLPLGSAQLKDCFRYDGSSSDDFPCDPIANVGFSFLSLSSLQLLLNAVLRLALAALMDGFAQPIYTVP